ncbi:hypothetical protein CPB86DRAFT_816178 [Serendipita vermifera]|nr:hypothetical protein CPB86DRAFT_816178 [Serendipita vermifera]
MRSNSLGLIFYPRNSPTRRPTTTRFSRFPSRDTGPTPSGAQHERSSNVIRRSGVHGLSPLPAFLSQQAEPVFEISNAKGFTAISRVECVVCRNEFQRGEIPKNAPSITCNHPPEVCVDCLQRTIQAAMKTGNFLSGISCPGAACPGKLDYFDVKKWAEKDTFERYDKLLLQALLRTEVPSYILCLSPTCGAGQEHIGGDVNSIVICYACGSKQCFKHKAAWHEGLTCEQWDEKLKNDMINDHLTNKLLKYTTKICPGKRCGRRISKYGGCDHMTCQPPAGCGYEFCWICLVSWKEVLKTGNSKHYDHCAYYTGVPGGNPAPQSFLPEEMRTNRTAGGTDIFHGDNINFPGPRSGRARRRINTQERVQNWIDQLRRHNEEIGTTPESIIPNSSKATPLIGRPNALRLHLNNGPYSQAAVSRTLQRPPSSRPQISIALEELNAVHGGSRSRMLATQGLLRPPFSSRRNGVLRSQALEGSCRTHSTRRVRFSIPEPPPAAPLPPYSTNFATTNNAMMEGGLIPAPSESYDTGAQIYGHLISNHPIPTYHVPLTAPLNMLTHNNYVSNFRTVDPKTERMARNPTPQRPLQWPFGIIDDRE